MFHENARRLVMANIAQTVNVLQAMVLTDGARMVLTPTYHVFAMNAGHQDATSHPVQVTAADAAYEGEAGSYRTLTTTVSSKDGSALVSLTNLDVDGPATVRLDLRGKGWEIARARVLAAPSVQAHNNGGRPGRRGARVVRRCAQGRRHPRRRPAAALLRDGGTHLSVNRVCRTPVSAPDGSPLPSGRGQCTHTSS